MTVSDSPEYEAEIFHLAEAEADVADGGVSVEHQLQAYYEEICRLRARVAELEESLSKSRSPQVIDLKQPESIIVEEESDGEAAGIEPAGAEPAAVEAESEVDAVDSEFGRHWALVNSQKDSFAERLAVKSFFDTTQVDDEARAWITGE